MVDLVIKEVVKAIREVILVGSCLVALVIREVAQVTKVVILVGTCLVAVITREVAQDSTKEVILMGICLVALVIREAIRRIKEETLAIREESIKDLATVKEATLTINRVDQVMEDLLIREEMFLEGITSKTLEVEMCRTEQFRKK